MMLLLLGCLSPLGPCSELASGYVDADGDGLGAGELVEACDTELVDNADDCDDDDDAVAGTTTFYADTDGDGYGDLGATLTACAPPAGHVTDATDCDDSDAGVNPGAEELCDDAQVDEDCDGAANSDDPEGGADGTSAFRDDDGDGWGGESFLACGEHDGVQQDGDCDDSDAQIHPDADEICDDDDTDEDCDGYADDDDDDAEGQTAWYADGDGDGHAGDSSVMACDGDGASSATDCDDANAQVHPDADEVCNGIDDDCDGLVDDDDDSVGDTTTFYADADGDGYGDETISSDACAATDDHPVDAAGDCDDADAAVNPDADEACNEIDDDCDGLVDDDDTVTDGTTWYEDADGDGAAGDGSTVACVAPKTHPYDEATDCDDSDAAVHPEATESCNDVDDDCDGLVDDDDEVEDASTWYLDEDGDGHGGATTVEACDMPSGAAASETDCDDADADVNPDADESCNDVDDDCDGLVDDDDTVTDPTSWYVDDDGDGHGGSTTVDACEQPSGTSADETDCDDTNADVNPDADEICNELDDDCDGLIDDDDTVTDGDTFYTDADGDGYGDPDASVTACDTPTDAVSDDTDCDDTTADVNPGETEICGDGLDNDCDASTDAACAPSGGYAAADAGFVALGELAADEAGTSVVFLGDADGDGLDDLAIGAPKSDDYAGDAGTVYVLTGATTGTITLSDATASTWGTSTTDNAGEVIGAPGDVDGDGYADLLIGAEKDDAYGSDAGIAWLVLGPFTNGAWDLSSADAELYGPAGGEAGYAVSTAGDQDGDGQADVLVGAHETDDPVSNAGSAHLVLAPSGALAVEDGITLLGEATGDKAGSAVAGGSDLDGDGVDDVLVGAREYTSSGSKQGRFYLLFGPVSADMSLADADEIVTGPRQDARLGATLTMTGDVDGDGYPDFAAGAPEDDGAGDKTGATYLFSGHASGLSLAGATALVQGSSAKPEFGTAIAAGEVDGDGHADLLIGGPNDDGAATDAGAGVLFYGPLTGTWSTSDADATFEGKATSDEAGTGVGLGDWNGDGLDDVALGAKKNDDTDGNAGGVWVWFATGS